MGFRLQDIVRSKQNLPQSCKKTRDVPRGCFAVYVRGSKNDKRWFVIPLAYLNQPSFQDLLFQAEEEFGYDHPMGGITIPCSEVSFLQLISHISGGIH